MHDASGTIKESERNVKGILQLAAFNLLYSFRFAFDGCVGPQWHCQLKSVGVSLQPNGGVRFFSLSLNLIISLSGRWMRNIVLLQRIVAAETAVANRSLTHNSFLIWRYRSNEYDGSVEPNQTRFLFFSIFIPSASASCWPRDGRHCHAFANKDTLRKQSYM